jgi:hypothetical protein
MVAYHQGGEHKAGVKPTYRFQAVALTLTTWHLEQFPLRVIGCPRERVGESPHRPDYRTSLAKVPATDSGQNRTRLLRLFFATGLCDFANVTCLILRLRKGDSYCSAVTLGRRSAPMALRAHQGAIGQS